MMWSVTWYCVKYMASVPLIGQPGENAGLRRNGMGMLFIRLLISEGFQLCCQFCNGYICGEHLGTGVHHHMSRLPHGAVWRQADSLTEWKPQCSEQFIPCVAKPGNVKVRPDRKQCHVALGHSHEHLCEPAQR